MKLQSQANLVSFEAVLFHQFYFTSVVRYSVTEIEM